MLENFVVKVKRINEETHAQTLKINCNAEEIPWIVIWSLKLKRLSDAIATPGVIKRIGIAITIEKKVIKNKVLKRNALIGILEIKAKENMNAKKSSKEMREFDSIEAKIKAIKEISFALGSIFWRNPFIALYLSIRDVSLNILKKSAINFYRFKPFFLKLYLIQKKLKI